MQDYVFSHNRLRYGKMDYWENIEIMKKKLEKGKWEGKLKKDKNRVKKFHFFP